MERNGRRLLYAKNLQENPFGSLASVRPFKLACAREIIFYKIKFVLLRKSSRVELSGGNNIATVAIWLPLTRLPLRPPPFTWSRFNLKVEPSRASKQA